MNATRLTEREAFDAFHQWADAQHGTSGETDALEIGARVKHYSSPNYGTVTGQNAPTLYLVKWDEPGKVTALCQRRYLERSGNR